VPGLSPPPFRRSRSSAGETRRLPLPALSVARDPFAL
jgi:hypothetical protein